MKKAFTSQWLHEVSYTIGNLEYIEPQTHAPSEHSEIACVSKSTLEQIPRCGGSRD